MIAHLVQNSEYFEVILDFLEVIDDLKILKNKINMHEIKIIEKVANQQFPS